jgi:excisionase family DNA binding protein
MSAKVDSLRKRGRDMEKILTAKELSQYLKLSESTIYKLASTGEIPAFKVGDSWRFELEEIQKMIKDSKRRGRVKNSPEGSESR